MTALDPTPIVQELNEEWRTLGQFRPETVRRLMAATERTAQWPLPNYRPTPFRRDLTDTDELVPMPRGGRTTYPQPDRSATILTFPTSECSARHPRRGLFCGEAPGHPGSHVAYGVDDRILDEWAPTPGAGDITSREG